MLLITVKWFAAENEGVEIRVKPETGAQCQKTAECFLQVGSELLPEEKELKHLSDGKMEADRKISTAAAAVKTLDQTAVVKICQLI